MLEFPVLIKFMQSLDPFFQEISHGIGFQGNVESGILMENYINQGQRFLSLSQRSSVICAKNKYKY